MQFIGNLIETGWRKPPAAPLTGDHSFADTQHKNFAIRLRLPAPDRGGGLDIYIAGCLCGRGNATTAPEQTPGPSISRRDRHAIPPQIT
ncbi:MAG: hypothetical protein ACLQIQ_20950 [Beijerinckiaceae bacterium]